eukprot:9616189-Lingulodinium_polyedra.AAC.1
MTLCANECSSFGDAKDYCSCRVVKAWSVSKLKQCSALELSRLCQCSGLEFFEAWHCFDNDARGWARGAPW